MATIHCGKPVLCDKFMPTAFDGKTIYIMKGIDWQKDRKLSALIVHDLVHEIQIQKIKDKQLFMKYSEQLEMQAIEIQKLYLSLLDV